MRHHDTTSADAMRCAASEALEPKVVSRVPHGPRLSPLVLVGALLVLVVAAVAGSRLLRTRRSHDPGDGDLDAGDGERPAPEPAVQQIAGPIGNGDESSRSAPAELVDREEALVILAVTADRLDVMIEDSLVTVVDTDAGPRFHRSELEGVRLLGG